MATKKNPATGLVTVRHYGQVATINAADLASWEASGWVADADAPAPVDVEPEKG